MPVSCAIRRAIGFSAALVTAVSPGATQSTTDIRLHREFLILAPGSIGSSSGLTFVIDTGASRTMVDTEIVTRLGLQGKAVQMSAFGHERPVREVTLHDLRIGPVSFEAIEVLAYEVSQVGKRFGTTVDAVVGLDILLGRCITIDYRSRMMQWECENGTLSLSAPLELRPPYLLVKVLIDQVPVRLVPDTGSEVIAVFDRAVPADLRRRVDGRIDGAHAAGALSLQRLTPSRISLGPTVLHHRPIYLLSGVTPDEKSDGVLAPRAFGMTRVQFDLRAMQLRWDLR